MKFDDASTSEHRDEATHLWWQRSSAVHSPHYSRVQLIDLDESLAASLDGVRVAGESGWREARRSLDNGDEADFFVATVLAADEQRGRIDEVIGRLQPESELVAGVTSALGWVSAAKMRDTIGEWSPALAPRHQVVALAAWTLHRLDPGSTLEGALGSSSRMVRTRAARAVGELGRMDAAPALLAALETATPPGAFWFARSALLTGDRRRALPVLQAVVHTPLSLRQHALQLVVQAMPLVDAHRTLAQLDGLPHAARLRIIGSGYIGDAKYVPWLIEQMSNPAVARIAGEAFVHITGADFNLDQLESMPPEGYDDGPIDDPDDDDVELPEDIALPWPDVERVKAWWMEHRSEFTPGRKLFLGKPITPEHCVHVLKTGYQRQRVIAAHYRSLIQPGTVLFPTSAPAWRQQKLLESM